VTTAPRPGVRCEARQAPPRADTLAALAAFSGSSAPLELESGVALLASLAARDLAPAVLAEVAIHSRDAGVAIGLGVLAVGTHTLVVGPASAAGPG